MQFEQFIMFLKLYGADKQKLLRRDPFIEFYPSMLEHILDENSSLHNRLHEFKPNNGPLRRLYRDEISEFLREAVNGKRIMEIGCRSGGFLRILQDHGAIVAGTTGKKYFDEAKRILGPSAVLVEANSDEIGNFAELRKFKPNILFNVNLFSSARWKETGVPWRKLYKNLRSIATPQTTVYLAPCIEDKEVGTSMLDHEKLRKRKGIIAFKPMHEHIDSNPREERFRTYRFRV